MVTFRNPFYATAAKYKEFSADNLCALTNPTEISIPTKQKKTLSKKKEDFKKVYTPI